jgi:hypothetical protein
VITETVSRKVREMKTTEQFALALRIIGVLGIAYVIRAVVRNPVPATYVLVVRVLSVLIGAYFIRGGCLLVKFAYPEATPEPPNKPNA